jgi:hypothetical protein
MNRNLLQSYVVAIALLICAAPAIAQIAMPDASQMAGVALGAPELADGTVTVRVVRERMGNNIAGQAVTLKGGGQTKTVTTDAQGRAQFDGFPVGATVTAEAVVDGESLVSQAFQVAGKGGIRVALVAGIAKVAAAEKAAAEAAAKEPARQGIVVFGGETRFIFEYQDDRLQVFYLIEILNNARTPIDVGGPLQFDLPPGAAGAAVLEGSSTLASVRGEHVTIVGPFPPGKTVAQIGFTLPNVGATLQVRQKFPAALENIFVAAEKIGPMQLTSPQLTSVRDANAEGQTFIMGNGGRLNAGDTLALDFTGLPSRSNTPRYAVMALAVVILAIGLFEAFTPGDPKNSVQARLQAKRERLMAEIVGLERKRRQHALTPGEEARHQKLVSDLEHVLAELDSSPTPGDEGLAA